MSLIFLHHLIQSVMLPPLNAIIIMIIGVMLLLRKTNTGKTIIVIACILLYVQSTPFFVYTLAILLEKKPITMQELNKCQAIIVLGGGIRTNAYEYPEKYAPNAYTLIRLQYAAYLAKQYTEKTIILSGGIASPGNHSEANIMKTTLQKNFGVTNPIILEEQSRNTNENAKFVTNILKALHYNHVAVVSQAFHSTRSIALFKRYGIDAIAAPTDYMGHYTRIVTLANFIPDAGTMADCSSMLHEIIGYFVYVTLNIND